MASGGPGGRTVTVEEGRRRCTRCRILLADRPQVDDPGTRLRRRQLFRSSNLNIAGHPAQAVVRTEKYGKLAPLYVARRAVAEVVDIVPTFPVEHVGQQRTAQHLATIHIARHAQNTGVAAVCMQLGRQDTWLVRCLEHHSTRTITKQNAGGAVFKIQNTAEYLCAHHQHALGRTGFDHGIRHSQCIDKTAAHCLHVKCRAAIGNA